MYLLCENQIMSSVEKLELLLQGRVVFWGPGAPSPLGPMICMEKPWPEIKCLVIFLDPAGGAGREVGWLCQL